VPTVVTLVAKKHGNASCDLVANLAGLNHIPFSQFRILPKVDIGVAARSAILDVLLMVFLSRPSRTRQPLPKSCLTLKIRRPRLGIQGIGGLSA
jgi:hypothetical protein